MVFCQKEAAQQRSKMLLWNRSQILIPWNFVELAMLCNKSQNRHGLKQLFNDEEYEMEQILTLAWRVHAAQYYVFLVLLCGMNIQTSTDYYKHNFWSFYVCVFAPSIALWSSLW